MLKENSGNRRCTKYSRDERSNPRSVKHITTRIDISTYFDFPRIASLTAATFIGISTYFDFPRIASLTAATFDPAKKISNCIGYIRL